MCQRATRMQDLKTPTSFSVTRAPLNRLSTPSTRRRSSWEFRTWKMPSMVQVTSTSLMFLIMSNNCINPQTQKPSLMTYNWPLKKPSWPANRTTKRSWHKTPTGRLTRRNPWSSTSNKDLRTTRASLNAVRKKATWSLFSSHRESGLSRSSLLIEISPKRF